MIDKFRSIPSQYRQLSLFLLMCFVVTPVYFVYQSMFVSDIEAAYPYNRTYEFYFLMPLLGTWYLVAMTEAFWNVPRKFSIVPSLLFVTFFGYFYSGKDLHHSYVSQITSKHSDCQYLESVIRDLGWSASSLKEWQGRQLYEYSGALLAAEKINPECAIVDERSIVVRKQS